MGKKEVKLSFLVCKKAEGVLIFQPPNLRKAHKKTESDLATSNKVRICFIAIKSGVFQTDACK